MKVSIVDSAFFAFFRIIFRCKKIVKRVIPEGIVVGTKIVIRFLRKIFNKNEVFLFRYQHMSWASKKFSLKRVNDNGEADVYWQGRHVYRTSNLNNIRNSHYGDCFLIGTGPSINEIDISLLEKKTCFGVNGAIAKFSGLYFKPKYYAVSTYDFFVNRFEMVREVMLEGIQSFFPFWGISQICEHDISLLKNAQIFLADPISQKYGIPKMDDEDFDKLNEFDTDFVLHREKRKMNDKVGFSRNLLKGYFHGENILYTSLQIAYFIGYRRFFIVGMDLNYSGPNPRFYEKTNNSRPTWVDQSFDRSIVPCFEIVRDLILNKEIQVYNVSPESRLPKEIITKVPFEDALRISSDSSFDV